MNTVKNYIESGILEQFVLGQTSVEESEMVQSMAVKHAEVQVAIDEISETMEAYITANAVQPPTTIKPFLLATIDFMERMKNGEQPSVPPTLTHNAKVEDYSKWLTRPDMKVPTNVDGFHARIIGHTPKEITAIVWIEEIAPEELHDDEYEKFLVLEGSCDILIGEEKHSLVVGDFLQIPLHKTHEVTVTSDAPCKVILQRTAA